MTGPTDHTPNCMRCQHHQITHELPFRYACLAMGFKSARLPCRDVEQNSGMPCQLFQPRPAAARS